MPSEVPHAQVALHDAAPAERRHTDRWVAGLVGIGLILQLVASSEHRALYLGVAVTYGTVVVQLLIRPPGWFRVDDAGVHWRVVRSVSVAWDEIEGLRMGRVHPMQLVVATTDGRRRAPIQLCQSPEPPVVDVVAAIQIGATIHEVPIGNGHQPPRRSIRP